MLRSLIRRLPAIALIAGVMASAGQASAAPSTCEQDDVQGIWQVYTLSIGTQGQPTWSRCVLMVDEHGVFGGTSKCTGPQGVDVPAGGKIRLLSDRACTYNGFISYGNVRNTIAHSAMSPDRDHLDGVGSFPGGRFMFNATKRDGFG